VELFKQQEHTSDTPGTKEEFILDVVFALTSAGIPLQKIDQLKPLLKKWVPSIGGSIPGANQLRASYLPKLLLPLEASIEAQLADNIGFSLLADESNDKWKHSPVNFLISRASLDKTKTKPILADIYFVDESESHAANINSNVLQEFIDKLFQKYKLNIEKFDAFVTDGAAYNLRAFELLKQKKPTLIHIWCVCHMLDLVGVAVQKHSKLSPLTDFAVIVGYNIYPITM